MEAAWTKTQGTITISKVDGPRSATVRIEIRTPSEILSVTLTPQAFALAVFGEGYKVITLEKLQR
jgi:hypothetical protein